MNDPILFLMNIPAELTASQSVKYHVTVETNRTANGRIEIEFLNLSTHFVCNILDWQKVFSLAKERAEAQWRLHDKKKDPDDLFLTLGDALNPVLTRQNFEQCNF